MTINEIESIVQSLYKRHENLTEAMLLLLLEAGGWEKKTIKEAIAVYRNLYRKEHEVDQIAKHSLPPLIEEPVLPLEVDSQHLLDERTIHRIAHEEPHNEDLLERVDGGYHMKQEMQASNSQISSIVPSSSEQQSLITHQAPERSERDELPHNLPLKPFETTPHIWSFARYKSIFFGEDTGSTSENKTQPPQTDASQPRTEPVVHQKEIHRQQTSIREVSSALSNPDIHTIYIEKTPLSKDDEKLALLTSFMLLAILLLLGYMYSNGRL